MSVSFTAIEQAVQADVKAVRLYVRINGDLVDCTDCTVECGVDQPVSTASLTLPAELLVAINDDVRIEAGYDGATALIFAGRVPSWSGSVRSTGRELRVSASCYTSLLAYPDPDDLTWPGPIGLGELFRSLCAYRGIPAYFADDTTALDGTPILLGGVSEVDAGLVRIKAGDSPLDWLRSLAELFGFRVFGAAGATYLRKVTGNPPVNPDAKVYEEYSNAFEVDVQQDTSRTINVWTVNGAKYTTADGQDVTISSQTEGTPYLAALDPPGWRADQLSDERLVTQALADACLASLEFDRRGVFEVDAWLTDGDPRRVPGEAVQILAKTFKLSDTQKWLTSVSHSISASGGYTMRCTGWVGDPTVGTAPIANDCATVAIAGGPWHVGDDTVSWYAVPAPGGVNLTVSFTSPGTYSSITLTGLAHGCNSVGERTATNGSEVQVWQLADPAAAESGTNQKTKRGSAPLPVMNEEYSRQRAYGDGDTYWNAFSLNLKGDLRAGAAELRFVSTGDDYEVKNLTIETCGAGSTATPDVSRRLS